MKLLIMCESYESQNMFIDLFHKYPMFDIDYFNFLPKVLKYDAIVFEKFSESINNISDIPVFVLHYDKQICDKNIIAISDFSTSKFIMILKKMYNSLLPNNLAQPEVLPSFSMKIPRGIRQMLFNLQNNSNSLKKLTRSLQHAEVNSTIIRQIILLISEILIKYDLDILNLCININENDLNIVIPFICKEINLFSSNRFADKITKIGNGIEIAWKLD